MAIKVQISYAPTEEKATEGAWEQWKNNIFPSKLLADINTADKFDDLGEKVRKQDLKEHVIVGSEPQLFIDKIKKFRDMGFEKIIIHNVNKEQEDYIDFFGNEVLPKL
jgi:coenzyme F420-dependent glucose-6-phosphate dehydrogenase